MKLLSVREFIAVMKDFLHLITTEIKRDVSPFATKMSVVKDIFLSLISKPNTVYTENA